MEGPTEGPVVQSCLAGEIKWFAWRWCSVCSQLVAAAVPTVSPAASTSTATPRFGLAQTRRHLLCAATRIRPRAVARAPIQSMLAPRHKAPPARRKQTTGIQRLARVRRAWVGLWSESVFSPCRQHADPLTSGTYPLRRCSSRDGVTNHESSHRLSARFEVP